MKRESKSRVVYCFVYTQTNVTAVHCLYDDIDGLCVRIFDGFPKKKNVSVM